MESGIFACEDTGRFISIVRLNELNSIILKFHFNLRKSQSILMLKATAEKLNKTSKPKQKKKDVFQQIRGQFSSSILFL